MNKNWTDKNGTDHSGNMLITKDGFDVIECTHCGLKHVIPLVDQHVQEDFYGEQFYQKEIDNYIKRHQEDFAWWSIDHNEKYDLFEKYLGGSQQKDILDIGSGPGFFLKIGKERGWNVLGVEPGKPAYEYSTNVLGLNVKHEFFSKKNHTEFGKFNVIHMNNVLEHVVNPIEMMELVKEILLPGGLICISSPNDFNPLQLMANKELGKEPWWVVPRHHINYFDSKSLNGLFARVGIQSVYETTSFPLELFMFMGEDYVGDNVVGKSIHKKRMLLESHFNNSNNNSLKRQIYNKFAELCIGREITVIGMNKK